VLPVCGTSLFRCLPVRLDLSGVPLVPVGDVPEHYLLALELLCGSSPGGWAVEAGLLGSLISGHRAKTALRQALSRQPVERLVPVPGARVVDVISVPVVVIDFVQ
jgi:hypothetical protein